MSETEHNKGKLVPVSRIGSVEEKCKAVVEVHGFEKSKYHETFKEALEDEGYRSFFITDTEVYKIESEEVDADGDIMNATRNTDGTIDFETRFYNGSCSFNEAIKCALEKHDAPHF